MGAKRRVVDASGRGEVEAVHLHVGGVVIELLCQRLEAAIVHVGRGAGHVAQARHLEAAPVGGPGRDVRPPRIARKRPVGAVVAEALVGE